MTTLDPESVPPTLAAYFTTARAAIDRELERRLRPPGDDPGRLVAAMHYAGTGPGKRLRPIIALAAADACGGTRAAALPAAAAIELLHAYTLVHDDLPAMDDDDERRGRATVHVAFGEATAILAGDGLLTAAFGALAELEAHAAAAVAVLAQRGGAIAGVLRGQAIDLLGPPGELATIEQMHELKTGSLFAAAAELGAIAAGAAPDTRAALARYGMAIGVAFQHADDRDDAELVEHASEATRRMRELCEAGRGELQALGSAAATLDALAGWIASRA